MDLYQACRELQIWTVARAYAEVWRDTSSHDYNKIKELAKKSFKKLACKFHPDMPGADHSVFLKVKDALDVVNNSTINQLFDALDEERKDSIKYFTPGSSECKTCIRWNNLLNNCIFMACRGFELNETQSGSFGSKVKPFIKFEELEDAYIMAR